MTSGSFDHSCIWSRTKMWRRNASSVHWASEIRSGKVAVGMECPSLALGIDRSGAEFDAVVKLGQRKFYFQVGKRDRRGEALIDFAHKSGFGASMNGGDRRVLFEQYVGVQRGDRQVRVLLLAFVDAAGRVGKHLQKGGRLVLRRVPSRGGAGDTRCMGVVEANLRRLPDANLGVGIEWPTR